MKTKIAVITPFYKGNQYVSQLVACIETNTKKLDPEKYDVELIIVNDSPDVAVQVPEGDYKCKVSVVNHEKNGGIHRARVTGLSNTAADYILFLDQDDVVDDCFLLNQLAAIGQSDVIVANAWIEYAPGKKKKLYGSKYEFNKVKNKEFYLRSHNMIVSPGQCLIKRNSIPSEWCEKIMTNNGSDDLFLWLLMFSENKKFGLNNDILYTHRYTGANLSADGAKMNDSSLTITDIVDVNNTSLSPRDYKILKRARQFGKDFRNKKGAAKLVCLLSNLDMIVMRAWWKALTVISCKIAKI